MGFGVFIHRTDSIYDDSPAEQYQFPSQYLGRVQSCVGDWIIYYEPRKVTATRGYFAVAKVVQVIPDPKASGMYLALIEPGSYLDFVNAVPFSGPEGVIERGVLNDAGRIPEGGKQPCDRSQRWTSTAFCRLAWRRVIQSLPDRARRQTRQREQASRTALKLLSYSKRKECGSHSFRRVSSAIGCSAD